MEPDQGGKVLTTTEFFAANSTTSVISTDESSADLSDSSSAQLEEEGASNLARFHEARWESLRQNYFDEYLDLFKTTFSEKSEGLPEHFEDSQIGAVFWTGKEKEAFFDALARKGRDNMAAIQSCVPSKSILEIADYRDLLREADADRQRFEKKPRHVSHPEIPAAYEISPACENLLDEAADALAAFQDHYDHTVGANESEGPWLIDKQLATVIDHENDERETSERVQSDSVEESALPRPVGMFHVSTFLKLSEELFMNAYKNSHHDHWQDVAEPGQHPALTVQVLTEFRNLVISLTQRIVQSALFLAQSRIRAAKSSNYSPSNLLTSQDVHAALDVLYLRKDSWDFWKGFARRSGIKVILGGHGKSKNTKRTLSLAQVEGALSVRKSQGRRRSLSILAGVSSDSELDLEDVITDTETEVDVRDEQVMPSIEITSIEHDAESEEESDRSSLTSEGSGTGPIPDRATFINRQKRRLLVEDSQDEFMEELDQRAREHEESSLMALFGSTTVKLEGSPDIGKRPKALRKTKEELQHWSDGISPMSQWERDGEPLLEDAFRHPGKRRKID